MIKTPMGRRSMLGFLAAVGIMPPATHTRLGPGYNPLNPWDRDQVIDPSPPDPPCDLAAAESSTLNEMMRSFERRTMRNRIDGLDPDIWAWRSVQPWAKAHFMRRREDEEVGPIRRLLTQRGDWP